VKNGKVVYIMRNNRVELKEKFSAMLVATGKGTVTKSEIKSICAKLGISGAQWFTKDESNRVGRGLYKVPGLATSAPVAETIDMSAQVMKMPEKNIVPNGGHRIWFLPLIKIMYRLVTLMTCFQLLQVKNSILSLLLVIQVMVKQCLLNRLVPNLVVNSFAYQ